VRQQYESELQIFVTHGSQVDDSLLPEEHIACAQVVWAASDDEVDASSERPPHADTPTPVPRASAVNRPIAFMAVLSAPRAQARALRGVHCTSRRAPAMKPQARLIKYRDARAKANDAFVSTRDYSR
jgi:hypothetical protein